MNIEEILKGMIKNIELVKITITYGENINDAYREALIYSASLGCPVRFSFNDTVHCIDAKAIIKDLIKGELL